MERCALSASEYGITQAALAGTANAFRASSGVPLMNGSLSIGCAGCQASSASIPMMTAFSAKAPAEEIRCPREGASSGCSTHISIMRALLEALCIFALMASPAMSG